jgi:hypothetical protein
MYEYKKFCPICSSEMIYNRKYNLLSSIRKDKICRKCTAKKLSINMRGENNPFFGKKHTDTFKENLSKKNKGKHFSPFTEIKSNQILNPTCNLSMKERLILAYGETKGIDKWKSFIEKQRLNNKGDKNSMYNKCTPIGSGNGWSGWYKGWYFRSILELSYMISIIERFNICWESAEKQFLTCKYTIDGINRTYRADFLLNSKYLIDCKPKKLQRSRENTLKRNAMEEFCKSKGLIFKYTDITRLTISEIERLYDNKEIKFLERYERKFEEFRKKK